MRFFIATIVVPPRFAFEALLFIAVVVVAEAGPMFATVDPADVRGFAAAPRGLRAWERAPTRLSYVAELTSF